ncbi:prohibitin family protein [uncultured Adlercreutzia sp.]|uniref:prohibitin family protein n=1 Tax=uncultured Adlercreutzia sp. TaxID=875803 RepID=UPI0025844387|nr:prohibitin family protein [uncultured Adlercreutzia sp.]
MSLFTKTKKYVRYGNEEEVTVPNVPAIVAAAITALVLIVVLLNCFAVVGTGQAAVVTRFGNVVGTEGQGFHLKLPVDRYNMIDVTQQQVTSEYSTATKDNQSLTQEITAQVVVKPDMAEDIYVKFLGNHMDGIVAPVLADGFKNATAAYSIEEVISARDKLSADMLAAVQPKLDAYGIQVVSVEIKNVALPEEYKAAVERQKVAERDQVTAEVERQTAEIDAEKNKIMAESLSDENFRKLFYEKWDGKLPAYMGGDGGLDMLLPQLQEN